MLSEHDTFISILKGPRCHPVEYMITLIVNSYSLIPSQRLVLVLKGYYISLHEKIRLAKINNRIIN